MGGLDAPGTCCTAESDTGSRTTATPANWPPVPWRASRTSRIVPSGRPPIPTSPMRWPESRPWTSSGYTASWKRFWSASCVRRLADSAWAARTSLRSEARRLCSALETSPLSPIATPRSRPIISARKTATSESAW